MSDPVQQAVLAQIGPVDPIDPVLARHLGLALAADQIGPELLRRLIYRGKEDGGMVGEAAGSKREKAVSLGVPLLDEEDFLKILNQQ